MKTSVQILVSEVLSGSASYAAVREEVMSETPESANAFFAQFQCRLAKSDKTEAEQRQSSERAALAAQASADAADLGD